MIKHLSIALLFSLLISSSQGEDVAVQEYGFIDNVQKLITIDREIFQKKASQFSKISTSYEKLTQETPYLDPDFILSLFLHTNSNYLSLIKEDPCFLHLLIDAGIAQAANGKISDVFLEIEKKGEKQTFFVPSKDFHALCLTKQCPHFKDIKENFLPSKLKATFQSQQFNIPTDEASCQEIHNYWRKNPNTPYFCRIAEIGKEARLLNQALTGKELTLRAKKTSEMKLQNYQTILKALPQQKLQYLENVCNSLKDASKFCQLYLNMSFWKRVASTLLFTEELEPYCPILSKKKTKDFVEKCARQLDNNPLMCTLPSNQYTSSFAPRPNCLELDETLKHRRLNAPYQDCPSAINNEAITHFGRLINHLQRKNAFTTDENTCHTIHSSSVLSMLKQGDHTKFWNNSLCYHDPVKGGEVCLPVINGDFPGNENSEGEVLTYILNRTKGMSEKQKCQAISKVKFKPQLLEYKTGCFLIFDPETCFSDHCPKKIIWNEKELTNIRYETGITVPFYPVNLAEAAYSLSRSMRKLEIAKFKNLNNFSLLRFFLEQKSHRLAQALGCQEDFFPGFFKKFSFGQCTPVPLIIEDAYEDRATSEKWVVIRSAIDQVHSPRRILWNNLFSGVKNYQQHHPLGTWTLQGVEKYK